MELPSTDDHAGQGTQDRLPGHSSSLMWGDLADLLVHLPHFTAHALSSGAGGRGACLGHSAHLSALNESLLPTSGAQHSLGSTYPSPSPHPPPLTKQQNFSPTQCCIPSSRPELAICSCHCMVSPPETWERQEAELVEGQDQNEGVMPVPRFTRPEVRQRVNTGG